MSDALKASQLVPTSELRYVWEFDPDGMHGEKILQQKWVTVPGTNAAEWRNVPTEPAPPLRSIKAP